MISPHRITPELMATLAGGLRDRDFEGWERTPAGWVLNIPGIGFARVTGSDRLICIVDEGGQHVTLPVTSVRWTFSVEITTSVPGLAVTISPTSAREARCSRTTGAES